MQNKRWVIVIVVALLVVYGLVANWIEQQQQDYRQIRIANYMDTLRQRMDSYVDSIGFKSGSVVRPKTTLDSLAKSCKWNVRLKALDSLRAKDDLSAVKLINDWTTADICTTIAVAASQRQLQEARKVRERLARHEVWIGMTKDQYLRSQGKPDRVNRTVTASGTHEQWVYEVFGSFQYAYFDNGVLTGWQD